MTLMRFAPADYQAIRRVCRHLDLTQLPPGKLKALLAEALSSKHPELADRLDGLSGKEQLVLHQYLLGRQRPSCRHGLTAEERGLLKEAFGPLLRNARFARPLRRALVRHFQEHLPELAEKLDRMSQPEFEAFCEGARRGA